MSPTRSSLLWLLLTGLTVSTAIAASPVQVTMKLDSAQIAVGATTTLHVYAQIAQGQRANSDRIFSWYVDLLSSDGSVARVNAGQLTRTRSDQDPLVSSSGVTDGPHRRGIYDTFINLPAAGRDAPVELFAVPIQATAQGRVTFRVQAGTGTAIGADFLVAPVGGGDPLMGGDYSAASVELQVGDGAAGPSLAISVAVLPNGQGQDVTLRFSANAGRTHAVEARDELGSGLSWQPLPGAPHNSGTVVDRSTGPRRFYRLRVSTP